LIVLEEYITMHGPMNIKFNSVFLCQYHSNKTVHSSSSLSPVNTLRTGDADLHFYITTVQDG